MIAIAYIWLSGKLSSVYVSGDYLFIRSRDKNHEVVTNFSIKISDDFFFMLVYTIATVLLLKITGGFLFMS